MRRKPEPLQIKECLLHAVHLRAFRLIRNQRLEDELLLCLTFARIRRCETLCYKVEHREAIQNKIVIFSDALSVMQALSNPQNKELNVTVSVMSVLQNDNGKTVHQLIPAHCNIPGNEEVDILAKKGENWIKMRGMSLTKT
ncbi:hypothetical protein LSAT2_013921 [Lamellibrachia satsuma]|nr:hypothetical protein LSAT2_013921 [Lamellibrachia satsuma]